MTPVAAHACRMFSAPRTLTRMNSGLQAWQTLGVLLAPWIRIWKAVGTAYSSSSSGGGDATRNTVSAPVRTLTISCTVQRSVQTCETQTGHRP